eukprot:1239679-Amphidinium_carterae.1
MCGLSASSTIICSKTHRVIAHRKSCRCCVVFALQWEVAYSLFQDVMSIVSQWQDMPGKPLDKRFKFCRKVNATICQFSALVSFLVASLVAQSVVQVKQNKAQTELTCGCCFVACYAVGSAALASSL